MRPTRREILGAAAALSLGAAASSGQAASPGRDDSDAPLIIDTHQHLWDLDRFELPWLKSAPAVLRQSYGLKEYAEATRGLNARAVYMEVDVDPKQHDDEAEFVIGLAKQADTPNLAAVIGGRPAAPEFAKYAAKHAASGLVKGVRQVLHGDAPTGFCARADFIRGVRALGAHGLSFDFCVRPTELLDCVKLARACPDTRFVLDHCGNADIAAFHPKLAPEVRPAHEVDAWKRDLDECAKQPNMIGKISGIIARAPRGWKAEHLAPIVNHCLDAFGPDRVVFGGDWPVCLLGASLRQWIDALGAIVSNRPAAEQRKLWSENAIRFFGLTRVDKG